MALVLPAAKTGRAKRGMLLACRRATTRVWRGDPKDRLVRGDGSNSASRGPGTAAARTAQRLHLRSRRRNGRRWHRTLLLTVRVWAAERSTPWRDQIRNP